MNLKLLQPYLPDNNATRPACHPFTNEPSIDVMALLIIGGKTGRRSQAKNWLGERLDATRRSQVIFMDRDDILNLFIVTNLPLPKGALPPTKAVGDL